MLVYPSKLFAFQLHANLMFKALRVLILLLIFATVAQTAWQARSRASTWQNTLYVGVYPILADDSPATRRYVEGLNKDSFAAIDKFFAEEARRYQQSVWQPVSVALAAPQTVLPPLPAARPGMLDAVSWSLRMRWWAWRHDKIAGPKPAVRLFVLFHDPLRNPRVAHSVGLEAGMIGLVNAFAAPEMSGPNNVIIAHELLHTLGARDKYDTATNLPQFPDGYAEPARQPLLPQEFAEIMGGRIPVSKIQADIPYSLAQTLVGPATAAEIGWMKK